jgi:hypothetical protein
MPIKPTGEGHSRLPADAGRPGSLCRALPGCWDGRESGDSAAGRAPSVIPDLAGLGGRQSPGLPTVPRYAAGSACRCMSEPCTATAIGARCARRPGQAQPSITRPSAWRPADASTPAITADLRPLIRSRWSPRSPTMRSRRPRTKLGLSRAGRVERTDPLRPTSGPYSAEPDGICSSRRRSSDRFLVAGRTPTTCSPCDTELRHAAGAGTSRPRRVVDVQNPARPSRPGCGNAAACRPRLRGGTQPGNAD